MLAHSPRAFPWEIEPPVGTHHVKSKHRRPKPERADRARGSACAKGADASTSRGVGTSVTARTRNAGGRSAAGRRRGGRPNIARTPPPKPEHAQAEKRAPPAGQVRVPRLFRNQKLRRRVVTQQNFFSPPLCDRPGCYEPPVNSARNPARYCCPACRQAVRNVLDRERKWLSRGTLDGRTKRAYRVPGRTPAPTSAAATRHRHRSAAAGTSAMTIPPGLRRSSIIASPPAD